MFRNLCLGRWKIAKTTDRKIAKLLTEREKHDSVKSTQINKTRTIQDSQNKQSKVRDINGTRTLKGR